MATEERRPYLDSLAEWLLGRGEELTLVVTRIDDNKDVRFRLTHTTPATREQCDFVAVWGSQKETSEYDVLPINDDGLKYATYLDAVEGGCDEHLLPFDADDECSLFELFMDNGKVEEGVEQMIDRADARQEDWAAEDF